MDKYTQDNRQISISTPLGKDVLLLAGFHGSEAISHLFSFELDLFSDSNTISFGDIIGKRVLITVNLKKGKRYFHGMICRFSQVAGQEMGGGMRFFQYRATLVPWTWLLTRTSDSRIFQNLSVTEIIEKIFRDQGFSDYSMETQGQYDKRDYCVQYRETDFNFISRLMEEEGIYYYFTHSQNTHTMVIADAPGKHKKISQSVRHFRISDVAVDEDTISVLEKSQEVQAGKYSLNDFNFEMPNTSLKSTVDSQQKLGPGEREMYDFPGGYSAKASGDKLARIRMEEEEARITTIVGSSSCREFTSGYRFTLTNAYRQDLSDKEYLLTAVEHRAVQGWEGEAGVEYSNSFSCIPFTIPFRPPLATAKPLIHGSQTAIVTGPSGEEIHTDKYGRVKVQFHWDREGKKDDKTSCWIRVGQTWAGQGWGAVWIPRIGHEVIVSFLEGDPDRPLITGSVYDGTNMPPYALPAEKTKSTIKSNSSKGGGGFNELRFEDKKGSEEIYLQGEKNWSILIKNDKAQNVGHDETLIVGNNRTKDVKKDQSETIGQNKTISVGKDHTESIGANAAITVAKDQTVSIGENSSLSIGKDSSEQVSGKADISVGKDMSTTVGSNSATQVSGNMGISVDKKLSIQATDAISIASDKEITLKCGDATIVMKKNGDITIKGGKITVNASGNLVMKGSKLMGN